MDLKAHIRRIIGLRDAFRACFMSGDGKLTDDGQIALNELRRFCHGGKPTIRAGSDGIDPYASIAAAARQEVYFRIMELLSVDDSYIRSLQRLKGDDIDG